MDNQHIFISHVAEDQAVALELALQLEKKGYSTWCYELDCIPGPSHLDQTLQAIETSSMVLFLMSPDCIKSHQVTTEITRTQDRNKQAIPLLYNLSHEALMQERPAWGERFGSTTFLSIDNNINVIMHRLIQGLNYYLNPAIH